jgi:hypothetical protein
MRFEEITMIPGSVNLPEPLHSLGVCLAHGHLLSVVSINQFVVDEGVHFPVILIRSKSGLLGLAVEKIQGMDSSSEAPCEQVQFETWFDVGGPSRG